jgi:hypothetical protein
MRRAFQGHGAAAEDVGGFDILSGEPDGGQEVERGVGELLVIELQHVAAEGFA